MHKSVYFLAQRTKYFVLIFLDCLFVCFSTVFLPVSCNPDFFLRLRDSQARTSKPNYDQVNYILNSNEKSAHRAIYALWHYVA